MSVLGKGALGTFLKNLVSQQHQDLLVLRNHLFLLDHQTTATLSFYLSFHSSIRIIHLLIYTLDYSIVKTKKESSKEKQRANQQQHESTLVENFQTANRDSKAPKLDDFNLLQAITPS